MNPTTPIQPLRRIAVPAAITLLLSLVRLIGEVCGWAPKLFGTAAGGGGALLGISWLIPLFGAWFGWRLAQDGITPPSLRRALLLPLAGLSMIAITFVLAVRVLGTNAVTFTFVAVALPCYALLAFRGWPALARVLLAYAFAARVPVMAITVVAVAQDWGTHYEKLAPGAGEFGDAARTAILCTAQLVIWIPLTLLGGGLAGGIAAALARRR